MSNIKFTHYSYTPLSTPDLEDRVHEGNRSNMKPNGLWLSVDGDDDWESWCKGESFSLDRYKFRQSVTLRGDALRGWHRTDTGNVLLLDTVPSICKFAGRFGKKLYPAATRYDSIDWLEVMDRYDGIIISPYQWSLRMDMGFLWYYGWDCASGCIWNKHMIESIGPSEPIDWVTNELPSGTTFNEDGSITLPEQEE